MGENKVNIIMKEKIISNKCTKNKLLNAAWIDWMKKKLESAIFTWDDHERLIIK